MCKSLHLFRVVRGLWAVQAILVSVLPPAGEAPAQRVMRERASPSPCFRRCGTSQLLPHPPQCEHWGTFRRWGKDFTRETDEQSAPAERVEPRTPRMTNAFIQMSGVFAELEFLISVIHS